MVRWDNNNSRFTNEANLRQFYSWISPDNEAPEEVDNNRRIHDHRQIKKLGFLVAEKQHGLMNKLDQWEITIDQAHDRTANVPAKYHWREAIQKAADLIAAVPQGTIEAHAQPYLGEIGKLLDSIERSRKMVKAAITNK